MSEYNPRMGPPPIFQVGEIVVDEGRPSWGEGRIVEDRTFARSPTSGQRLYIDFQRRGLVTVYTAQRVLRKVEHG